MSQSFHVVDVNPNDNCGGGGCLCSPIKGHDTQGPFVVFPNTETESNLSPHAVVCAPCIVQAAERLETGETLAGGERSEVVEDDVSI